MSPRGDVERISMGGVTLEVHVVPWDTAIFGFPVADLAVIETDPRSDLAPAMLCLRDWLVDRGIHVAYCRLDSLRLRESMALEDIGFRFVEMVYGPSLQPLPTSVQRDERLRIEPVTVNDLGDVERIAETAFHTGRYVLDRRLDPLDGHRRYRVWVENSARDPRHQILKGSLGDEIVGFFVVEVREDGGAYWHLTAIAPGFQGKGLGRGLWRSMIARHRDAGLERIETTVSGHNVPAINLYASLGFRIEKPRVTLHWVREPS